MSQDWHFLFCVIKVRATSSWRKKSHKEQYRVMGWVRQRWNAFCYQNLLLNERGMGRHVVMMQDQAVLEELRSHTENTSLQTLQDANIELSSNCLSGKDIFMMNYAVDIEKNNQHCLQSRLRHPRIRWSFATHFHPLLILFMGLGIIFKYPGLISSDRLHKKLNHNTLLVMWVTHFLTPLKKINLEKTHKTQTKCAIKFKLELQPKTKILLSKQMLSNEARLYMSCCQFPRYNKIPGT